MSKITKSRTAPIDLTKEEFRKIGHQLIDQISDFFSTIEQKPVTPGETPKQLQQLLKNRSLPETGTTPGKLIL